MRGIEGNSFLVVGGANGIGKATTIELIKRKANVIIADIDKNSAENIIEKNKNNTSEISFFYSDISKIDDLKLLSHKIKKKYKTIHGIANIAAINVFTTTTQNFFDWEKSMSGCIAPYGVLTSMLIELMPPGSSIVNMSSISSKIAQPNFATYSVAKAGVSALSRCQALDFSIKGIRVNSVCPGTIWTENNSKHIGLSREEANASPNIGQKHILNRCGEPEEVADAIIFLLSKNSSFITGTEIIVDGGYLSL